MSFLFQGFQIGESPEFTVSCRLEVCKGKCISPCQKTLHSVKKRQADLGIKTLFAEEIKESLPSKIIDIERGVVVVTKREVPGNSFFY